MTVADMNSAQMMDALLRRRMAIAKSDALYKEAEEAMMRVTLFERQPETAILAGAHRGKARTLITAADHIVRTELVEE